MKKLKIFLTYISSNRVWISQPGKEYKEYVQTGKCDNPYTIRGNIC